MWIAAAKSVARTIAYAGGALGAAHRVRHRDTLTVVMFHRVLVPGSAAQKRADPAYCISTALFDASLRFFRRNYNVVALGQVRASLRGSAPLPPHSLLITFDDGWSDNASVALPILRAHYLPAAVFIAAEGLGASPDWWWQDILLRILRERRRSWEELWALGGGREVPCRDRELALLVLYGELDGSRREELLAPYATDAAAEGPQKLRRKELQQLANGNVEFGAHGAAHLPLTMIEPRNDLKRARAILEPEIQGIGQPLDALSFPHGRYDAASVAAAHESGFSLLFTSDPCVNATPRGRPNAMLGRIPVDAAAITDRWGDFAPPRLATWLFHRRVAG